MKLLAYVCLGLALTATGCSTLKELTNKKDNVSLSATMSAEQYTVAAMDALAKNRYKEAANLLNDIITFYPTSSHAKQALLDLIYVQYLDKNFEAVIANTARFLTAYPNSPEAAYALYAQGVTNMQGSPKAGRLIRLDQSQRDTAYLRLAFADFSNLLTRYPNSPYSADTALRMTAIYNDFAAHELVAAYWYLKRGAYVAAANRAKWVFQYYPQAEVIPEAIAILAYANGQLGLQDTADQYKTLLSLNYPAYLDSNGQVHLPKLNVSPWQKTLAAVSFGKLGQVKELDSSGATPSDMATRRQRIQSAQSLQLPALTQTPAQSDDNAQTLGFGLPSTRPASPNSAQAVAIDAIPEPVPTPVP